MNAKQLTKSQINKKYNGIYVEISSSYDYSTQSYLYTVIKTSKVIRENMCLGKDVGTSYAYRR